MQSNTLVVSFFAGPGARKSTLAASVFSKLKWKNVNCELVTEYAKDKVWEETKVILNNQIYVFAKQHHRIWRLLNKVDVIVTDSPFVAGCMYDIEKRELLRQLMLFEYSKLNTLNYFVVRSAIYNPAGRLQTEEQSRQIDNDILNFLDSSNINFSFVKGEETSVDWLIDQIFYKLGAR